jgi:hypothetical protein
VGGIVAKRWRLRERKKRGEEKQTTRQKFARFKTRKAQATLGGLIVAVILVLSVLFGNVSIPNPFIEPGEPPDLDFYGNATLQGPLLFDPVWNECTEDYRPVYEQFTCEEIRETFGLLPPVPPDLSDVAKLFYDGVITLQTIEMDFGERYWMQPEFYAGWSNKSLVIQRQPQKPYWTPFGYSFYFSGAGVSIGRNSPEAKSGTVTMNTLLRTGWGTDTWQGFHLYPAYPEVAFKQDGTPITDASGNALVQDPTRVPFRVIIENPSDGLYSQLIEAGVIQDERREGGQFFVLPPAHPRLTREWTRILQLRIEFTVPVDQLQQGIWFFALYTANGSPQLNEQYAKRIGNFYVPSGEWLVGSLTPLFQGFVVIR